MNKVCKQKIRKRRLWDGSVVSGYGKRSINLNKVVANFEKHIFLSQTDLTRTGIISNSYNERNDEIQNFQRMKVNMDFYFVGITF
jgi:hypothetical protein